MMKKLIYKLNWKPVLVIAAIFIFSVGCNDWIDIEPENYLIQQEFWKTKSDVMNVVAATYDAARDNTLKSFLLGEVRADQVTADGGEYYNVGRSNIYTTDGATKWAGYYKTINLANTVMYFAPIVQGLDRTITDSVLNEINSEMLFVRSLSYFYLVRIWKEVPLVLRPTISDTVDFYIPKSSESKILKQLSKDLKRASGLASTNAALKGRANKYAIQALMADVMLWGENYEQCIIYCDSIINSGKYSLEPKSSWFSIYYPGNSMRESIFEIQYDDQRENQESPLINMGNGKFNAATVNKDKFGFIKEIDIRICGTQGPSWKYVGRDETGTAAIKRAPGEYDPNFIYYRYADILLMKAEALAELGRFDQANQLVQQIAERAGTTYTYTNIISAFRVALLSERGREFSVEGKRWFDLLRVAKRNHFENKQILADIMLSKAKDAQELAVMKTKVIDTMSYFLPIHEDEIKYNRNLVQNPFYDR